MLAKCCAITHERGIGGVVVRKNILALPVGLLAAVIASGHVAAQSLPGVFAGKTVTLIIGFGTNSQYDLWGHVVARHVGKHLPGNPAIVTQNMEGAGSYRAANFIYNIAPKDGTSLALIARDAPLGPLSGAPGARYDATKLSWIGTPTVETNVCIAYKSATVKTAQDLLNKELIVGNSGAGSSSNLYPKALKGILGLRFRVVSGYPATGDVLLAIERGEVEGICESFDAIRLRRPEWITTKTISILFQGGTKANPELTDVPLISELAHNEIDKQAIEFLYAGQAMGRPFVAPPNLPADRLKMLRVAFMETMTDPEFLAEARQRHLAIEPKSGEELEALITKAYATPKPIIDRVGQLIK
jgi:tripartite-type tricarboxylate transporter receptor subunit TctC